MARKPPTPSTVKKVFALSGNTCARPNCNNKLVEDDVVIGEICHIEAAEEGGPRFNEESNDEYRRSGENLLALCESCHKKVDADENKYLTSMIKKWKDDHESKNRTSNYKVSDDVVDQSIEKFLKQRNYNSDTGVQINNQAMNQNIETQIGVQNNYSGNPSTNPISGYRPVNEELKSEIERLKENAAPPQKDVIDFRNNLDSKRESEIYELPFSALKFRKANGRIKAEVESYERLHKEIDEISDEGQNILRGFLAKSDPEKKEVLKQQIKKKGQREPAIITCDGFLINGNRRKMVFEELYKENHQNPKFSNMRVVILPENTKELEIKRLENSYQLQEDGKSEYHGLNRALTLRANIKQGYTLEAQIKDDPKYSDKEGKELKTTVKDFEKKFLNPLKCVDRYLNAFGREGLYTSISEGVGDREGRWQAFIDYSSFYYSTLCNPTKRYELGIKDGEEGRIENTLFKIIRKRNLNSRDLEEALGKVHSFMRGGNLKKYLTNPTAKKHLMDIAKIDDDLPKDEKVNEKGEEYTHREIDDKWGIKHKKEIFSSLMQAYKAVNQQSERDKPLDLLEDALKKLNHENLQIENMGVEHLDVAIRLTEKISKRADTLYEEIDKARFNLKNLGNKRN